MNELYHPHRETLKLHQILYALADPSRLRMIMELTRTTEIASTGFQSVKAARGTIAYHLKTLRLAGITRTRFVGTKRRVSLRRRDLDGRYPELLDCPFLGWLKSIRRRV